MTITKNYGDICNKVRSNQRPLWLYPEEDYSAYQILNDLGGDNVSSIQRYSTENGAFETAGFTQDGLVVGANFTIVAGEGYFIFMKQEVLDFQ